MSAFASLGLAEPILQALNDGRYNTPTPIQTQAIPHVMAGRDLLGIAQTGTGKTAAFALPILHRLAADRRRAAPKSCRVLVLSPTRELASQIAERFRHYGRHLGITSTIVFGGVAPGPQIKALAGGIDVLVATPGRLLDHIGAGHCKIGSTEIVVLDEADQMFDMGFIHAIRKITALLPQQRQSLFFSATMPPEILRLSGGFLRDPARVEVTPAATTAERVTQRIIHVEGERKRALLAELFTDPALARTLVFTRTKHGADRVTKHLESRGISAAAIHGNKSQSQRERALAQFKAGKLRALVATDIAARGIDVTGVSHVVNFELPNIPESYVHRIGRTARAGAAGMAISLCDSSERDYLRDIERTIRQRLPAEDRRGTPIMEPAAVARPVDEPQQAASQQPQRKQQHGHHNAGYKNGGHKHGGHGNGEPNRNGQQPGRGRRRRQGGGGGSGGGLWQNRAA